MEKEKYSISLCVEADDRRDRRKEKRGLQRLRIVAIDVGTSGGKKAGGIETQGPEEKRSKTYRNVYTP